MQRLTGMDATFVYMETPTTHFHVVGTLVLDPSDVADFGVEKVKKVLLERIHLLPPFRRRLVATPFNLAHPQWMEDGSFDIDNHIHRVGAPRPGGMRELAELTGDIAGRPLDRSMPLWQMWFVEGLEDDKVAIVTKMHHAAIDGVSGADLMVHLFDLTPEVAEYPPPEAPWRPEEPPSDARLAASGVVASLTQPAEMARAAGNLIGAGRNLLTLARSGRGNDGPSPTLPFTAPRTPWNGALTAHRSVAYGGCALEDMKTIKRAFDCKINDVVLAASTGTLRDWLALHGGIPDSALVASVPVSVRTEADAGQLGNKMSSMFVSLPVHVADPVERLELIREDTRNAKEVHGALGADMIQGLAEVTPPGLANLAARLYSASKLADRHRPVQNLVVSNVPGPPMPLYCAGARVLATYPMGPLIEGSGLNFTVLSNVGNVDFGVMACRELVPDPHLLADGFGEHVALLLSAAERAVK